MKAHVRPARPGEAPLIHAFIVELARYERLEHMVEASVGDIDRALFEAPPSAHCLIAERDAEPVGFALWYLSFSTFVGRSGVYLEDLYVRPEHRGAGVGRALLAELARCAQQRGAKRVEWSVLDWNEPALRFYRSLGARPMADWTVQRLTGEPLAQLAAEARP